MTIAPTLQQVTFEQFTAHFQALIAEMRPTRTIVEILKEVPEGTKHRHFKTHNRKFKLLKRVEGTFNHGKIWQKDFPDGVWVKREFDPQYARNTLAQKGVDDYNMEDLFEGEVAALVGSGYRQARIHFDIAVKALKTIKDFDEPVGCWIYFYKREDAAKALMLDIFHDERYVG